MGTAAALNSVRDPYPRDGKRALLLCASDQPEGALLPLLSQLSMFADESARPEGLHYQPDFISAQEEAALIGNIRALPLAPFQFGIYEGKRRVVFFGSRYDFTHQRLEAAEELPAWLMPLTGRVERFAALPSGSIKHALCTEYDVGAGIGWHRDKKHFDQVFGLSLASACKLRFRRKIGNKWERFTLNAQPRSLYLMTGASRHIWEHSIPPVETPRYSITFRTMGPSIGFDLTSRSAAISCRS